MWRVMARFIKHARVGISVKRPYPLCWGLVDFSAEENSEGYILKIHERKNSLVRPPIVNIDQAVVIMSVKEPDFNSNLLDRFLVLWSTRASIPLSIFPKWICWKIGENWILPADLW